MLVLNFMYMKKNLFRFSSRRFLFSTVMASALVTGAPQAVFANVGEVQAVSQTGVIKGKIVDMVIVDFAGFVDNGIAWAV